MPANAAMSAVLAVNEDRLALGGTAALYLHVRVLPSDEIARRITVVERIRKVANLSAVPDEGPLDFRNSNVPGIDKPENGLDGICGYAVTIFHKSPN